MKNFLLIVGLLLWRVLPAADMARADLDALADSLLAQRSLRGSSWGILFYSLRDDSVIYERNADALLIPASVTKLITSAAALDALGPSYRCQTVFQTEGVLGNDGVLHGDLIVAAAGDPTAETKRTDSLRAPMMKLIADSLLARGLRYVDGNIVLQTLPFVLEVASSAWEIGDVNTHFAPCADGFGFNNNVCELAVHPGNFVGASPLFTTNPPYAPLRIQSKVVTVSADDKAWLHLQVVPDDTAIVLTGAVPVGDKGEYLWIPMQNPALYYGRALQAALHNNGIDMAGRLVIDRVTRTAMPPSRSIYGHESPPLSRLLSLMNKDSDNYTSEYVLRLLGVASHNAGDARAGLDAVMSFLHRHGIDTNAISLEDGCGLARQNLVTARAIVHVLRAMYRHPARDAFLASLAVSGSDGTLQQRLSSPTLAGRVLGKTGTMSRVSALAGYVVETPHGPVAFAMLCNNYRASPHVPRQVQDLLVERLVNSLPSK